jgi:hypothetical protein
LEKVRAIREKGADEWWLGEDCGLIKKKNN